MYRVEWIRAPDKGTMAMNQNCGDLGRIDLTAPEGLNDHVARLQLVFGCNLLRSHFPGAGNLSIEVIPLGGAHGRHALACLGKGGSPAAVGVDNDAQSGEGAIKGHVGIGVAGGLSLALYPFSRFQTDYYHVFGFHVIVLYSGRLNNH